MRPRLAQIALLAAFCVITLINLAPLVWAFLISIKQPVDAFSIPPKLIFAPTAEFHYEVWFEEGFLRYLLNSLIVSISVVVISVSLATMSAYGLTRLQTTASRNLLFGLLAVRMLPNLLLAVPFFVLAQWLGLINTYTAMILSLIALNQPAAIWLMRSFFEEIPQELYEAAEIDGCNKWQSFYLVALPIMRPGIWVTSLFALVLAYNEFLFALLLSGADTKTLPVAIAQYGGEDLRYWSISAAAAIAITLPIVVFMLVMQRHLVRGVAMGAVKG